MALSGYPSKCILTVQSSNVPADAVDIVVPVVAANLPSELLAASGGCKDDGSDIRFALDGNGVNLLPREIIFIDKAQGVILIRLFFPSISSSADLPFYVFWGNQDAGEPSETSESGARTVWQKYYGVFPYKDIVNEWKGIKDHAGRWSAQTPNGTVDTDVGHIEGATAVRLSSTFGINLHEDIDFAAETFDLMFWVNYEGTHLTTNIATGQNGIPFGFGGGGGGISMGWGGFTMNGGIPATGWHHVWFRNVAGSCRTYVNGVDVTGGTGTANAINFATWGDLSDSSSWLCSDLRKTRNFNHAVGTIQTMVAAETNPAAFIVAGTPETVTEAYTLTINGLIVGGIVSIFADDNADPQDLGDLLTEQSPITSTSFDYVHYGTDSAVIVQFMANGYEEQWIDFSLAQKNQTLTIIPKIEENL